MADINEIAAQILSMTPAERARFYALAVESGQIAPKLLATLHRLCSPNAGTLIPTQSAGTGGAE